MEFPILADGEREKERRKAALSEREKRVLSTSTKYPSESLNTDPSDLFPSDISGPTEWQGTQSPKAIILLRAHLLHPSMG
jgi:hypothetical protein